MLSGVTMVFVPSVSTFAISRLLGGGTQLMLGDLIEQQLRNTRAESAPRSRAASSREWSSLTITE